MSDLIKRSDAIEQLNEAISICPPCMKGTGIYRTSALEEAIDIINQIQSADRPQETCLKEAEILLKATRNLLNKQNESIYVLNMLAETVTYHGAECDGLCLMEDIDAWLELYGSEKGADDEADNI